MARVLRNPMACGGSLIHIWSSDSWRRAASGRMPRSARPLRCDRGRPGDARLVDRPARRALPAGRRRRVQRRQERVHQRAARPAASLQEGVTPTTAQIHVLRTAHGDRRAHREAASVQVTAPVDLLRDVHIVDTPGTNAIIREHERLTTDFVPRADLVLFVTSADRPFTETERAFLRGHPRLGQEDRHRRQQDRHLRRQRSRARGARPSCATRRGGCWRRSAESSRSARGWRSAPSRASHRCGRRADSKRSSGSSRDTLDDAGPFPPEAREPARRRRTRSRSAMPRSPTSG